MSIDEQPADEEGQGQAGPDPADIPGYHPPKQERSRRTLDRLVRETEEMLRSRTFEELSVDEIVERANSSKGAFYTRFDDKKALLEYLRRERFQEVLEEWSSFLRPDRWEDRPLAEFVEAFLARLFRIYRRSAGPMREFIRHTRIEPEPQVRDRGKTLNEHVVGGVLEVCRRHRDEISHPDPERAVEVAIGFTGAIARERLLFTWPAVDDDGASDPDTLEQELVRAFCRYLGIPRDGESR